VRVDEEDAGLEDETELVLADEDMEARLELAEELPLLDEVEDETEPGDEDVLPPGDEADDDCAVEDTEELVLRAEVEEDAVPWGVEELPPLGEGDDGDEL
jgi:hypothetical protein